MSQTTVRTTCPYCGVGCGVLATTGVDGRIVVTGDPDHPANFGKLCGKGATLADTLNAPDRLTQPLIQGQPADWDQALDMVAEKFRATIADYGPDAVAFYVSGQLLTEDYYVANKLAKGFLGTANIDTNSRLCMASSVAGHKRGFGSDTVPGCYEDLDVCDLAVIVGGNMAWCHPVLFQRLQAARRQRGTKIVVIDPRRCATAEDADLFLPILPGSDTALFLGLLAHLDRVGTVDRGWLAAHADHADETLAHARAVMPDIAAVAQATGVAPALIAQFFALFTATERTVTLYSQGVNQSAHGTDKVNAILNCHFATGRIGRAGLGPFSLTGQPNAMGGREVGGLANQLAAHMGFGAEDRALVAQFWQAPNLAQSEGLKAVDLFRAVGEGKIKALWIMATNPAVSMPDAGAVRAALAACPFVVVSDCTWSDTAAYAHVVLPAAGWGEKDGTVTNSERRISRQRSFYPMPAGVRPDWAVVCDVAGRLGFADAFAYRSPADIFREHAALSNFDNHGQRDFALGALADLDDAGYDDLEPVQWPVDAQGQGRQRLFDDGRFYTKSGRAKLEAVAVGASARTPNSMTPLRLITGRLRDQWHTMTRTGLVAKLLTHRPRPQAILHPTDAMQLGISDGDMVRIASACGSVILPALADDEMQPGQVFASMHWSERFASHGVIDRVVHADTDPWSGQPELKHSPVAVSRLPVVWRGYLLSPSVIEPHLGEAVWWCRRPVDGGHLVEIVALPGAPSMADVMAMLAPTGAQPVSMIDGAAGRVRVAWIAEDQPLAIYAASLDGLLPDWRRLLPGLGKPVADPASRASLLTGMARPAGPCGSIVCSCHGVTDVMIRQARDGGAVSVAAIGEVTRAGTQCGSCQPEIGRILREGSLQDVA